MLWEIWHLALVSSRLASFLDRLLLHAGHWQPLADSLMVHQALLKACSGKSPRFISLDQLGASAHSWANHTGEKDKICQLAKSGPLALLRLETKSTLPGGWMFRRNGFFQRKIRLLSLYQWSWIWQKQNNRCILHELNYGPWGIDRISMSKDGTNQHFCLPYPEKDKE